MASGAINKMRFNFIIILSKRLFSSLIVLFLVVSFVFFLVRLSPGDPSQKFISPHLSPKLSKIVAESYNFKESLSKQYLSFLTNAAAGDFGISYDHRIPVREVISEYLPFTLLFTISAFILQIFASILLAIVSTRFIGGWLDKIISKLSMILYATPVFVIALFLIYLFSISMELLPASGFESIDSTGYTFLEKLGDYSSHLLLPLLTLTLYGLSVYYRYLRDNIEEAYNKNFVLYLRANGYGERTILLKHVLPNALSPLISVAGIGLGLLFSGAVVIEVIFSLPGMGRLTLNAIQGRDYPLVIGCTFIAGLLLIISNFLADLVKVKIDKRLLGAGIM